VQPASAHGNRGEEPGTAVRATCAHESRGEEQAREVRTGTRRALEEAPLEEEGTERTLLVVAGVEEG